MEILTILVIVLLIISFINVCYNIISKRHNKLNELTNIETEKIKQEIQNSINNMQSSIKIIGEVITANQKNIDELQIKKLDNIDNNIIKKQEEMNKSVITLVNQLETRFKTFEVTNEQKLEAMRATIEKRLRYIQEDNNKKLDEMRNTVDEKLQKTLEDKMTNSFRLVNDRLEQVYKGLGEMQSLASGVTDLKKVLTNVKTRGMLGEMQLGAILSEILTKEQYEENVAVKPNSTERVEFAIKLPNEDGKHVYLPIDSKFPADTYVALQEAIEKGDKNEIDKAANMLSANIKNSAKQIRDKYIDPPNTTEFAIMFLPFEGLYAEVINRGLVEILQREYHVNISGPSTMAALLNSLQMGFKTVAIQKRSSEVWNILGAVKTEFDKFGNTLLETQQKLEQANDRLDKLVGVRTRAIQRKLRNVEKLDEIKTVEILEQKIYEED